MKISRYIISFSLISLFCVFAAISAEPEIADASAESILPPIKISGNPDRLVFFETFDGYGLADNLGKWTKLGFGSFGFDQKNTIDGKALVINGFAKSETRVKSIPINLKPNKQYRLAYYVKTGLVNCDGDVRVTAGDKNISGIIFRTEDTPGWLYCEKLFHTTTETIVNINLISNDKGTILFDQIMLFETQKMMDIPHPTQNSFPQS